MSSARTFFTCFVVAFCLATAGTAGAYHSGFVANNCNYAAPTQTSYITRDGSITVALRARWEGYQWGGGCWNDNNRDDAPGDPPEIEATYGEGPDCSGFTFKVWRTSTDYYDTGFYQWGMLRYIHGPYTAAGYKGGAGYPNLILSSKTNAIKMDAFASANHIGMIYSTNANGTDQIIEAKGEAYGTNIWTRTYRGDSSYGGARRAHWSP
jgi:hypothetical protein